MRLLDKRSIDIYYKISFEEFYKAMSYDLPNNQICIEIEFCVDNFQEYQCSWLGKTQGSKDGKAIYWFGLAEDGSQAYDFESFEGFSNARVFYGKSLKDIWKLVSVLSIDACGVKKRLPFYLGLDESCSEA